LKSTQPPIHTLFQHAPPSPDLRASLRQNCPACALLVKPVTIACFLGIVRNKWFSALSLTAFAGRQEEDTGKARNAERNASGTDSCEIKFGHFWAKQRSALMHAGSATHPPFGPPNNGWDKPKPAETILRTFACGSFRATVTRMEELFYSL
jgi:hypothetical protein